MTISTTTIDHTNIARARTTSSRPRDAGQAAVLVINIAAVLLVAITAGLATMGGHLVDHRRAQSAADAAALASLEHGRAGAIDLAERHGAAVVSWQVGPGPDEVTVTVRVGDTTATARASNAP